MSDTQENHDKAVQAEETSGQEQGKPELPASETFYRTIGEAVPDFIWACTADGKALYVNARWTEYTGLTLEQADSVPAEVMHHPEDYPKLLEIMRTALANKAPFEAEFRFRRYDGTYHWFMARAVPVKDAEGNILQWIGTTTDIEKRKATEEALKASEERFRFALANSSISVYMQDRDLRYTWVY